MKILSTVLDQRTSACAGGNESYGLLCHGGGVIIRGDDCELGIVGDVVDGVRGHPWFDYLF